VNRVSHRVGQFGAAGRREPEHPDIETAEQWWEALAVEPAFAPLLTERSQRFAGKQRQDAPPIFDIHVAALREAGFREVETIWQVLSNRVLLAVR
jgi:hypothetical protein